uniref:RRM domain-containing protein n=1 Tax=Alexandrium andersonii TaxID=327968 RepID=A0A7S2B7S3_9DINO
MTDPSERVYVGSLPEGMDDATLKQIFGAYGGIKDLKNMTQKKACILVFDSLEQAKWVVENLDGNMPEGIPTPVNVSYAYGGSTWNKGGGGGGGGGGSWSGPRSSPYGGKGGMLPDNTIMMGGGKGACTIGMFKRSLQSQGVLPGGKGFKVDDSCQVYIRGLPPDATDRDLADIFGPFGPIPPRGIKAMLDQEGNCTGVGFVDYLDPDSARAAVNALDNTMSADGTCMRISIKNSTRGKGK